MFWVLAKKVCEVVFCFFVIGINAFSLPYLFQKLLESRVGSVEARGFINATDSCVRIRCHKILFSCHLAPQCVKLPLRTRYDILGHGLAPWTCHIIPKKFATLDVSFNAVKIFAWWTNLASVAMKINAFNIAVLCRRQAGAFNFLNIKLAALTDLFARRLVRDGAYVSVRWVHS